MARLFLALFLVLAGAAPLRAAEIKLVTWNLSWLTPRPPGDPRLPRDVAARAPADLALLRAYAARLEANVIAVQEVDGPEGAALVFDPARWTAFFPDERDVQRAGILVRRGLRAEQNPDLAALDLVPDARFSLRRGVDVTVHAGGSRLRVLSVHLKAGCRQEPLNGGGDCDALSRQNAALAGWIAQRREEGAAWAIAGDFNRRFRGERDEFGGRLAAAAPFARVTAGASNPCWGGRPFIDHVLLGGAARGWMREGSLRVLVYAERGGDWRDRLSDHCPVSVRLDLP